MKGLLRPSQEELQELGILDITDPQHPVEILLDERRGVMWVNVGGVCVLRMCQVKDLVVNETKQGQIRKWKAPRKRRRRSSLLNGESSHEPDAG